MVLGRKGELCLLFYCKPCCPFPPIPSPIYRRPPSDYVTIRAHSLDVQLVGVPSLFVICLGTDEVVARLALLMTHQRNAARTEISLLGEGKEQRY